MPVELEAFLKPYLEMTDALGILLVGSSSRAYRDALSDQDLEVIVTDAFYAHLPLDQRLRHDQETELLFLPQSDFLAKKNSPADIDHWTYEDCVVLHDPHGLLEDELIKIALLPLDLRAARLKLHYFEFLFSAQRLDKLLTRGDELNVRLALAHAATNLIKLIFLLNHRWPPVIHWTAQSLTNLPENLPHFKAQLTEFLRQPSAPLSRQLIQEVDHLLERQGFSFVLNKTAMLVEVVGPAFRSIRESYGQL